MNTAVSIKLCILLTALLALIGGIYEAAQKPVVRPATKQEQKAQTQAMTGWAKTLQDHK